ncbi:metal ABC transporter substrate-binding protein [Cryobacterium psychrophilum]|uniref:Zinc ABC transporter substrate-binding protein n=1 Tax=Cryobacterium psychrophilum TaxID=41988 RepID=A0A4Y8KN31_9MICO|nr:metal ABC transporter substrate-binding protein [Cryobacterium psychrophilum]TDW30160.1 zinc/manganese transport system substrate-binding protein/manganese/iron transport system substrate-binding protein [Cryobacterium psychrophilum]TFD77391.1 zinc ABC transporter substrate-binding protein [Cryobacterium psychrophilum]
MRKRYFAVPALIASATLTLVGCATPASTGSGAAIKIVTTTTQVADLTRAVVGDAPDVSLTQLIQPNESAHSYDPSVADLTALASADVLVINGVGLEEWLDDAIDASGFTGVTIDASSDVTVLGSARGTDQAGESAGHTDGDPHIWTDVRNAETIVKTVEAGLAGAEGASASNVALFAANAAAYSATLASLDGWIRDNIDAVPAAERLLVSNHDAIGYYTTAYGITYVGAVIPSFDDNAEPSAAAIDTLVTDIRATGVQAVFSEASLSPKTADTIAKEANVKVYSGDDALYVDSLGPPGSAGDTYLKAQIHNTTLILESWGATPAALPADLR